MAVLPHRPPFLFIDSVDEVGPGARVVATKLVRPDEWVLEGHFPDYPVLPGVIILEAMAQAGAILILLAPEHAGKIPLFAGADKVRFKQQVRPGDALRVTMEVTRMRGDIGWGNGTAHVGEKLACTAEIVFALRAAGSM